ncbi:ABC transporter permease [Afipia massiliensis]|uniref:ABC transporter permease n=1 Tax=Afipia massiliensis TaxID=211460 RepID=UPI00062B154F|nr:ABC transporter permease [Afipia massiliensis]
MANKRLSLAITDLKEALWQPIWWHLAWQEIRQRYRRSLIGPFWITISTGIMIAAMGPLYGRLFEQPLGPYFQHLAIGLVVWVFISGYLNEVGFAFVSAEGFIKDVKIPYSTYVFKVLVKHLIMFLHNFVIVLTVLLFFPPRTLATVPMVLPGLIVMLLNLLWIGTALAILCVRFRDIAQIVGSVVQLLFFLTPIMWQVEMLGERRELAEWNVIYHLIQIVRSPLVGETPNLLSWIVTCGMAVVGGAVALCLFARFRSRISYWI